MKFGILIGALAFLLLPGTASAQNWFMFEDKSEFFTVNFPEQPTITEIAYESEGSSMLPAKRYEASDGMSEYSVTVVNYIGVDVSEIRGAMAYAAWNFRKSVEGEITFDGYAQIDRVEGHQLQVVHPDMSKTYIAIHVHDSRLFILEANSPRGMPPPLHFQVSLGIFDANGDRVRYQIDANGQTERWYQGGAYGEAPEGAADLYDIPEEEAYQRELAEREAAQRQSGEAQQ